MARTERIEFRATEEERALILRAAELEGRSITEFLLATVKEAARRTVEHHESIRLNAEDGRAFVSLLMAPAPQPSEALRKAKSEHRSRVTRH